MDSRWPIIALVQKDIFDVCEHVAGESVQPRAFGGAPPYGVLAVPFFGAAAASSMLHT
jgi:hypothetical protein